MRRVTVQRVRDAYEKTGYYPISGTFRASFNGACPITAIIKAETGRTSGVWYAFEDKDLISALIGLTPTYMFSFLSGYDQYVEERPSYRIKTGFEDGQRVRRHFPPIREY